MIVLGVLLGIAFIFFLCNTREDSKKKLKHILLQGVSITLACLYFISPAFSMELTHGAERSSYQESLKRSPNNGEYIKYLDRKKSYEFYTEIDENTDSSPFMKAIQESSDLEVSNKKLISQRVTEFIELQEGEESYIEIVTKDLVYKEKLPFINYEISFVTDEDLVYRVHLKEEDLPEGATFSKP